MPLKSRRRPAPVRHARSRHGRPPRWSRYRARPAGAADASLRSISASRPMKSSLLVSSGTVKPMPASNGSVWSENSWLAKIRPASIRSMSSASRPSAAMPCCSPGLPHRIEHRQRILADGRRSHSRARPYSRCATRPPARPRNRRSGRPRNGTIRARRAAAATAPSRSSRCRMARLFGPCTAILCSWSVEERTQALKPIFSACWRSQMPLKSSPPIQRKLFGAEPEHACRRRSCRHARSTSRV